MRRRKISKTVRRDLYHAFDGRCAYCGCSIDYDEMEVDHVVPVINGGRDELNKLLPACHDCNRNKGGLTVEEFRSQFGCGGKVVFYFELIA